MSTTPAVVQGTLTPNGTLVLDEQLNLPAGRVRVTVQPLADESPSRENLDVVMARVWAAQKARGHVPRSKEAIDAEIRALRDEAEEEMQAVEQLQRQCRQGRESSQE